MNSDYYRNPVNLETLRRTGSLTGRAKGRRGPSRKPIRAAGLLLLALFWAGFSGCAKKAEVKEYTVLIKMLDDQKNFFRTDVLDVFEKKHNIKLNIVQYEDMSQLETPLGFEKDKGQKTILLVKVPFEMTRELVGKGYMKSINEIVGEENLDFHTKQFHQLALGLGYYPDGKLYYMPRKLETRVLFYVKSRVDDALKGWMKMRDELNADLKGQNGYGLPKDYVLEDDANKWDMYDLFVLGWFWKNTTYFDVKMPRIAHRAKKYEGTALGLIERAIGQGATEGDLLKMKTDPVARMFEWEARFKKSELFNPSMWEEMWDGSAIYNGIKDGKVFLSFIQQIDAFNIHGWPDHASMQGFLANPDDMGLALIPKQVSFALDKEGNYVSEGTRKVTTGGWWWGIPKTSPDPNMALELAKFITSKEIQAKECSLYGMIPVRKDILIQLSDAFDYGWVGEIFKISIKQIDENELTTAPVVKQYSEVAQNYIEAWYDIVVNGNYGDNEMVSLNHIQSTLAGKYTDVQKKILGDQFPQ